MISILSKPIVFVIRNVKIVKCPFHLTISILSKPTVFVIRNVKIVKWNVF